jgi:hypothetical protein
LSYYYFINLPDGIYHAFRGIGRNNYLMVPLPTVIPALEICILHFLNFETPFSELYSRTFRVFWTVLVSLVSIGNSKFSQIDDPW